MNFKIIAFTIMFFIINLSNGQEWLTDLNDAKKEAKAGDKVIVLVFQGSDWCAPCIKLDREIWSTERFKQYASTHYVMLQADFPRKRKNMLSDQQSLANAELAEQYNSNGIFPLVVILDENGTVLGKTGYKKSTPEDYIELINTFIK